MKKKALIYTLAVALLLSLAACHRPQTDQQSTEPEPPQMQATIPEAETTPEVPDQIPAVPEPLSETIPAEPDETEDSQNLEETASQEPAEPEHTPEPVEPETPVTAEPTETEPTTTTTTSNGGSTQQSGGQQIIQGTGYSDSSGDRDAFVNGLKDVFESQGYLEGSDRPMTDEDIAWITGQLNGSVQQHQYQGAQQQQPAGDVNRLLDTLQRSLEENMREFEANNPEN